MAEVSSMTAPVLPADCWAPVLKRWRHVEAGDVVLDPDGRPWMVRELWETDARVVGVALPRGVDRARQAFDPDATVSVLVPVAEQR